jgi:hypothetical protein
MAEPHYRTKRQQTKHTEYAFSLALHSCPRVVGHCGLWVQCIAWVARAMSLLNGTLLAVVQNEGDKSGEASPCQPSSWYTLSAIYPDK